MERTPPLQATDDYVHDNPWQAVSISAGVGFWSASSWAAVNPR
ncbi:DUF883 family protein [Candidatus Aalborgicola defluviihabitans]